MSWEQEGCCFSLDAHTECKECLIKLKLWACVCKIIALKCCWMHIWHDRVKHFVTALKILYVLFSPYNYWQKTFWCHPFVVWSLHGRHFFRWCCSALIRRARVKNLLYLITFKWSLTLFVVLTLHCRPVSAFWDRFSFRVLFRVLLGGGILRCFWGARTQNS